MSVRVGLLLCDHVRPGFRAVAGDYPDFFASMFGAHPDIELVTFDLTEGEFPPDLDACDGWITTGSRHSVHDQIDWIGRLGDLIRRFDEEGRRFVGVCFGAQMLAHALGGVVVTAPQGWQVGVKEVEVVARRPWMDPPAASYRILHSNADQIVDPGPRLSVLGCSPGVPISLVAGGDHMIGFQGHPDFERAYASVLMEARRGQIPDPVVDAGLSTLGMTPDRPLLAAWIARFLTPKGNRIVLAEVDSI
jgi:GMP synthase-like glutamine amidotransferase